MEVERDCRRWRDQDGEEIKERGRERGGQRDTGRVVDRERWKERHLRKRGGAKREG